MTQKRLGSLLPPPSLLLCIFCLLLPPSLSHYFLSIPLSPSMSQCFISLAWSPSLSLFFLYAFATLSLSLNHFALCICDSVRSYFFLYVHTLSLYLHIFSLQSKLVTTYMRITYKPSITYEIRDPCTRPAL